MLPQVQSRSQGHIASLPLFLVNSDICSYRTRSAADWRGFGASGCDSRLRVLLLRQPPPNPPPEEESILIFGDASRARVLGRPVNRGGRDFGACLDSW